MLSAKWSKSSSSSSSFSSSFSSSSLHYLPAERTARRSSWRHLRRPDRLGIPAWNLGRLAGSPSERTWWWPRGWRVPPACVGCQGRAWRPRSSLKRPRVLQALLLQVRKPFTPKTASRLRDAPSRASLLLSSSTGERHPSLEGFRQTPVARDCREGRFPFFLLERNRYKRILFPIILFFFTFEGTIVTVTSLKKGYILL